MSNQETKECIICEKTDCQNTINGYYPDDCNEQYPEIKGIIHINMVVIFIVHLVIFGLISYYFAGWKGVLATEIPLMTGGMLGFKDILKNK
jgi:hypothetical protein